MEGTAALRSAAPRWSLLGDQQLFDLLQDIHQRIISKCNDTNKKLEEMAKGLRDASVNLQNVNNKFLALSNTQFVESRVYDDDADVAPPAVEKEPPKPKDLASELTQLKQSIQVLESYHESLVIVRDSDSDTDSDDNDDRLVLKPKDLYADRPLPYIIGSQPWRSKWHAGLIPDESDSDSSTSKVEQVDQYSDSEDEPAQESQHFMPDRTMSTSTQSLQSEAPVSVSPVRPSPAALAADLARRLGGDIKIPEREPVYSEPESAPRKLYKPQAPLAATIFPDEPPPLEDQSSDDDIFAELHKSQPKHHGNKVEDLFDFRPKPSALEEALFGPTKIQTNQNVEIPQSQEPEPEIPETPKTIVKQPDDNSKKPVGGISLFGTNKHAESIGAAILKRNRRKSSTSGDESNTEDVDVKPVKEKEVKKERDIFDDLFAKSEVRNKKNVKPELKTAVKAVEVDKPKEAKKKDIFSDIFDDIDDIFSSDIVTVPVKPTIKNDKSLFSDDDDLFSEVSTVKKDNERVKESKIVNEVNLPGATQKVNLLSEVPNVEKTEITKDNKVIKEIKESKSIFDSDSDDGLFTNVSKDIKQNITKKENPLDKKLKDKLFDDDEDDELFAKNSNKPKIEARNFGKAGELSKKALFDSDDELFKEPKNIDVAKQKTSRESSVVANDRSTTTPVDKLEQDTQPQTDNSPKEVTKSSIQPTVTDSINNDIEIDIPTFESQKESTPEASHDSWDDEDNYTQSAVNNKTDDQRSEDVSELNDETHFKENILRTTRITSNEEIIQEKTPDIFNDSDDDLFRSKPAPNKVVTKVNEQTLAPQTPDLFSSPSDKNDMFSDIFDDVPPVFEKPKEPKKSKNVNALFDDDSDDEALFFKKNDVISDEKPEFSPSEERFGIFNDEPPAIDIDFTQKPNKKEEVVNTSRIQDEVSSKVDKTESIEAKTPEASSQSVEQSVALNQKTSIFGNTLQAETVSQSEESDGLLKQQTLDTTDNTAKETKKIGKLKPMNININVNRLLPGASPKKKQLDNIDVKQDHRASNEELYKTDKIEPKMVKSISFDDPEILDNKISKERAKIQVKRRPSTRRARKEAARISAVDFTDSSFDSSNDNSTKEEVREKVVKTVYILNDDDIFGTTTESAKPIKKHLNIVDSDEELFKKPEETLKNKSLEQPIIDKKSSLDSNNITDATNDKVDIVVNKAINEKKADIVNTDNATRVTEIKNETVSKPDNKTFLDSDDDDLFRPTKNEPTVTIMNEPNDSDDELFKVPPKTKTKTSQNEPSLFSNSDDEDLFKTKTEIKPVVKNNSSDDELFQNKGIGTLGKVYNIKDTNNIFDDFPPINKKSNEVTEDEHGVEEGTNKNVKHGTTKSVIEGADKNVKEGIDKSVKEGTDKSVKDTDKLKKSILDDLSDEEDLFKSKTKLMSKKDTSLFGDDGDDDDLFGTKPARETKRSPPVLATKEPKVSKPMPVKEPKAAEPVFVDPLSLFGDDDD